MTEKKTSEVQDTAQIYVSPDVDPKAMAYLAGIQARRSGHKPSKVNHPVGTVELPPIPRLDQEYTEGHTMAEHALVQRNMPNLALQQAAAMMMQQQVNPQSIVEPAAVASAAPQAQKLQLRPDDILPAEAKTDPTYIEGPGSMLAMNQPALAAKYGVIRGGMRVRAHAGPTKKGQGLSPETLAGLQALQRQSDGQGAKVNLPQTEEEAVKLVPEAVRGTKLGEPGERPGGEEEKADSDLTGEDRSKLKKILERFDEFDLDTFRRNMTKDMLNSEQQRKLVEALLDPLDVTELILHNRIKQKVPVIPGTLMATFQSMTGEEELAIKRLIMRETKDLEVSERYFFDKFALMGLALGLHAIGTSEGGKPLEAHCDANGDFDEARFLNKLARVMKFNTHMLACLANHHHWFELRVRKLFVVEKVGNG